MHSYNPFQAAKAASLNEAKKTPHLSKKNIKELIHSINGDIERLAEVLEDDGRVDVEDVVGEWTANGGGESIGSYVAQYIADALNGK